MLGCQCAPTVIRRRKPCSWCSIDQPASAHALQGPAAQWRSARDARPDARPAAAGSLRPTPPGVANVAALAGLAVQLAGLAARDLLYSPPTHCQSQLLQLASTALPSIVCPTARLIRPPTTALRSLNSSLLQRPHGGAGVDRHEAAQREILQMQDEKAGQPQQRSVTASDDEWEHMPVQKKWCVESVCVCVYMC